MHKEAENQVFHCKVLRGTFSDKGRVLRTELLIWLDLDMNFLIATGPELTADGNNLCGGPHLDKECPLNEEVKSVEEVKCGEGCSSPFNNGAKYHVAQEDDDLPSNGLPCQLLPKERFGEEDDDTNKGWEDPKKCGEEKMNAILDNVLDKLDDSWFSGTIQDEADLDGITNYLEPTSYDGFIDSENEAYKERSSYSKEVEFEVISTHNHVVKMLLQEGNEHWSKRHGIWTQKQAKLDSQDLLRRNHPAGVML
ncbi:hypothetical protein Tco_1317273 [Tanacetum coccineum]